VREGCAAPRRRHPEQPSHWRPNHKQSTFLPVSPPYALIDWTKGLDQHSAIEFRLFKVSFLLLLLRKWHPALRAMSFHEIVCRIVFQRLAQSVFVSFYC
jgi:hypothetical protein